MSTKPDKKTKSGHFYARHWDIQTHSPVVPSAFTKLLAGSREGGPHRRPADFSLTAFDLMAGLGEVSLVFSLVCFRTSK